MTNTMNQCVGTSQTIARGKLIYSYFSSTAGAKNKSQTKLFVVLTKVSYSNEDVHELQMYESRKRWPTCSPQQKIIVTADNLCGVVTGTNCHQSVSAKKKKLARPSLAAAPFIVIVTVTGSVLLQQPDSSQSCLECHDSWYKALQRQLHFVHSWPVTLDSVASTTSPSSSSSSSYSRLQETQPEYDTLAEDNSAFLCLNEQTIAIVQRLNYACTMRCPRSECRVKLTDTASPVGRLTVKRVVHGVETRYVVLLNKAIGSSVMTAIGNTNSINPASVSRSIPLPPTPPLETNRRPLPPLPDADYLHTTDCQPWTVLDTIIKLYNGNLPDVDTLGLSRTCLTELGIKLQSRPIQGCWRDMAEHLGLTLDDVDLIVGHASSRYNVPKVRPIIMMPAVYLLYHWQFVYNSLGVGSPPRASRPCTKAALIDLLECIGRRDLVALIEEWERSITRI